MRSPITQTQKLTYDAPFDANHITGNPSAKKAAIKLVADNKLKEINQDFIVLRVKGLTPMDKTQAKITGTYGIKDKSALMVVKRVVAVVVLPLSLLAAVLGLAIKPVGNFMTNIYYGTKSDGAFEITLTDYTPLAAAGAGGSEGKSLTMTGAYAPF